MEDFLIIVLQALFELFFQIIVNIPFFGLPGDWNAPSWFGGRSSISAGSLSYGHFDSPGWKCFWFFVLGCIIGGLSLLVAKHTFIHVSYLRVANLLYSPFVCGSIACFISHWRDEDYPKQRFWYSFCFTFGLALIRFTYGKH